MTHWTIRPAAAADLAAIHGLLAAADLPLAAVDEHLDGFLVADADGALVGTACLEWYGGDALLRSVAVLPGSRRTGLGAALVAAALDAARARRGRSVSLLTTTAAAWFPRFGFVPVGHEAVPAPVRASSQFNGVCPSTAAAFTLDLAGPTGQARREA